MKIEMVSSGKLDDLIEAQYYSSSNVGLQSNENRSSINRRDFIRYCSTGVLAGVLPFSSHRNANAVPFLIPAGLSVIAALLEYYMSGDKTSGDIVLINEKNIIVNGDLELSLLDSGSLDKLSKATGGKYKVPPREYAKYRFTNGPVANAEKETKVHLIARTSIDEKKSDNFTIRV